MMPQRNGYGPSRRSWKVRKPFGPTHDPHTGRGDRAHGDPLASRATQRSSVAAHDPARNGMSVRIDEHHFRARDDLMQLPLDL
jgi:hypothetical protein